MPLEKTSNTNDAQKSNMVRIDMYNLHTRLAVTYSEVFFAYRYKHRTHKRHHHGWPWVEKFSKFVPSDTPWVRLFLDLFVKHLPNYKKTLKNSFSWII